MPDDIWTDRKLFNHSSKLTIAFPVLMSPQVVLLKIWLVLFSFQHTLIL